MSSGLLPPLDSNEIVVYPLAASCLLGLSMLISCMMSSNLGLDMGTLQAAMDGVDDIVRGQAKAVAGVRTRGSLLLSTLLVAGTSTTAGFTVFMIRMLGMTLGFFLSATLVLVFVEIVPPIACTQNSLKIAAGTAWLARGLLLVLFPVAYPISLILDRYLSPLEHTRSRVLPLCRRLMCKEPLTSVLSHTESEVSTERLSQYDTSEHTSSETEERPQASKPSAKEPTESDETESAGQRGVGEASQNQSSMFEDMDPMAALALAGFGPSLPRRSDSGSESGRQSVPASDSNASSETAVRRRIEAIADKAAARAATVAATGGSQTAVPYSSSSTSGNTETERAVYSAAVIRSAAAQRSSRHSNEQTPESESGSSFGERRDSKHSGAPMLDPLSLDPQTSGTIEGLNGAQEYAQSQQGCVGATCGPSLFTPIPRSGDRSRIPRSAAGATSRAFSQLTTVPERSVPPGDALSEDFA